MDLVSLYVDQFPENDLSRERESRFEHLTIYPTVADALTLGGGGLAVDGVLLIGEHGTYGTNEKGQRLYPRYELFRQIVSVYRTTGKTAPIFNDKHLSWNWEWAREMYDTSREMEFAFMAGSSLPVTWRTPAVDMPLGGPGRRGGLRRRRRRRQLRLPRPRNPAVHGRAPAGRRDRGALARGVPRRPFLAGARRGALVPRTFRGRPVPQPHPDPGAQRLQQPVPDHRRNQTAGRGSGRLPLRAPRRSQVHHDPVQRPGAGLQLRGAARRPRAPVFDPDVPADAAGAHDPGQLLQPPSATRSSACSSAADRRTRSSAPC